MYLLTFLFNTYMGYIVFIAMYRALYVILLAMVLIIMLTYPMVTVIHILVLNGGTTYVIELAKMSHFLISPKPTTLLRTPSICYLYNIYLHFKMYLIY